MAHLATKRYNYWGQLAVLIGFLGVGLIVGGIASLIPLISKMNLADIKGGSMAKVTENLLRPENTNMLRWMQLVSTTFLLFLPAVLYAWLCHAKAFTHLGFAKKPTLLQLVFVIGIMLASLPMVSGLQELTEMLPWSKATLLQFKEAEELYNKQVTVIARMNNFLDYLVAVFIIAFLPALFEETLFRGAIQNLFSRWLKMPVLAIVITSIIFSAVHGSYLGFLPRFALGFLLGWVYYRTGNIWLNIAGHFLNNALALTVLYTSSQPGQKIDTSKMEDHFPLWISFISIAAVIGLLIYFEKVAKKDIDHPGEEVLMEGFINNDNPFLADTYPSKTNQE